MRQFPGGLVRINVDDPGQSIFNELNRSTRTRRVCEFVDPFLEAWKPFQRNSICNSALSVHSPNRFGSFGTLIKNEEKQALKMSILVYLELIRLERGEI